MNMNRIGKSLVLLHTAGSIVAMSWAAGIFLQFTDWGWKEPRSEVGLRIPSEYDKRDAAFKDAVKAASASVPLLDPARIALRKAEERLGENHLYYNEQLAMLYDGSSKDKKPFEARAVKMVGGTVVLDVPRIGKAVLEDAPSKEIKKPYVAYELELKAVNEKIDEEIKKLRTLTADAEKITVELNARDKDGNRLKDKVGIYDLLEVEKKAQDQAHYEKEYLQPRWVSTLHEAAALSDLRSRLRETLERLQKGKK